jgi:hypothetical protein
MNKSLIIEIPYGGLGDHLFHSHLPRIAKELGGYQFVYISNKSKLRHPDNKYVVWGLNPFVDGFVDEPGVSCDLGSIVKKLEKDTEGRVNLLDEIMLAFGLDDEERHHEPEIYYKPKFVEDYSKVIYDPNHLSCIGAANSKYAMLFFSKNNLTFEAIMRLRTEDAFYEPDGQEVFIDTPTLMDFCDLVFSSKKMFCLTSGTATLAAALKKPVTVFYGELQPRAFQHSKLHEYQLIERSLLHKTIDTLKVPYRRLRNRITKDGLHREE